MWSDGVGEWDGMIHGHRHSALTLSHISSKPGETFKVFQKFSLCVP